MSDQGAASSVADAQQKPADELDGRTSAQLRAPLLTGCIAYAILIWMLMVVILIYAWKLFGS